jgi:BirA family biotin operon repressor/biotin-[acetyl-CoA-carboxylase] ligase
LKSNPSDSPDAPAPLPAELADALAHARPRLGRLGTTMLFFPTVASTNDIALRLAAAGGSEGAVVIGDQQRAGRGRLGRSWFSPSGSGLYVSVVLHPGATEGERARAMALLTLAVGVAVAEGIETATGLSAQLKWPNDVYVDRRKLGGVLAESVHAGTANPPVVVGIGINVGAAAYPPELQHRATSLETALGRPVERAPVLAETLACLAGRYDDILRGRFDAILDAWRARAPGSVGAPVTWTTGTSTRSGMTAGIDGHGALLVHDGARIERIVAGEVTWL